MKATGKRFAKAAIIKKQEEECKKTALPKQDGLEVIRRIARRSWIEGTGSIGSC